MGAEVIELPRVNWHVVGAVGSVGTQVVIGLAALSAPAVMTSGVWAWYTLTYGAIAVSYLLVRRLESSWWCMIWPVFCLLRMFTFSTINHQASQLITGLMTLCFLYAGLTQPQRRSLLMLPLAALTLNTTMDLALQPRLIRLGIAVLIWTVSAELPALLMRHLTHSQHSLMAAARTDVLTGARNRFGLTDTLVSMRGNAFLVLLDLDKFKDFNDRHGHGAGDGVLADFAEMLHHETRRQDVVVRYGGEEFLVVIGDVDKAAAEKIVERWAAVWRRHGSGITFSAGITDLCDDESVSVADAAMYRAKAEGRDRVVVRMSASAEPG